MTWIRTGKYSSWLLMALMVLAMGAQRSYASSSIVFGPDNTRLEGSIRYTVLGQYRAHFRDFKGIITLGDDLSSVRSVDLDIKAASIISNSAWCDRIAVSRRLLNAARYPDIIFRSRAIIQGPQGFKVLGLLQMHGIIKAVSFPFEARIVDDRRLGKRFFDIRGSWSINRKDFHIVWNRYLDHGGVLVSDQFVVDWGIRAEANR